MEQPVETPQPAPRRISQERQRITGLPLYFQGYLSVRHVKSQYSQKLDISATNIYPNENDSSQFILTLSNEELEVKAGNCEYGKEWKGFILTVAKLSVPPDELLLPEQLKRMQEVLEKEKKRRIMLDDCSTASLNNESLPSKDDSSTVTAMPACFYAVSRKEAIEMLEKNPSCGNLILRPGSDSKNYSITVRHGLNVPCIKHYRVMYKGTSYIIELERKVTLASLQDVINYFVTQTHGNLKPFVMETCHNALQMAHSSESKTQKSPAEGQRHKEELTGTPLLQLS
ncbi:signal-transducing adaptor protein 1 isoform X2 [Oxyura jamaicensis]|uniref:signal-transducing adaptor protein 1 isoform X2 n=1 Tax=Oxyura jamaicensis TaxID=8884 RepID=UPI0015A59864|nr:signal-transducing adaptor protein 1 isoform X2 [Oxyura jamaicensis]